MRARDDLAAVHTAGGNAAEVEASRRRLTAAVVALREAHLTVSGEPFVAEPDTENFLRVEHQAYELLARTAPSGGTAENATSARAAAPR